jgi:Eco57I restriction-modification methylase/MmeI, target recognition domain
VSSRPGFRRPRPGGYDHNRWLDLVEATGPFLSVPVLRRTFPAGLDPIDPSERATLRARHADYFDVPPGERDRDEWIRYMLTSLLGWGERLQDDPEALTRFALEVPEHGETITPSFALTGPDGTAKLLGLVCDGQPTGRIGGSAWSATPADRLAQLLRRHDVPLGLVTDGRWWVLVRAPHGKATTQAAFDASLWREERDLARAFVSLLSRARFFGVPDEETLPGLLDKSQEYGEEITEALGVQVRRAVELLIEAIGQAEEELRRQRPSILPLDAHEAYVGAVTVMMRLVFLLFAEDRHLLPNDDPVYQSYYSASRLVDELEARAAEPGGEAALQQTDIAWHRLLALFRAVHGGVHAGSLHLPPYDGSLFDPGTHPWLEGRFGDADDSETEVLRIDDRTVMHMLRAVQYVEVGTGKGRERRRLTFASLDVEQIGYVYEGLLGFDAFRADDVVLGLTGRPGDEEEVPLSDLEDLAAAAISAGESDLQAFAERLSDRYKGSGIGSPSAVAKKLDPLTADELPDARRRLLSATSNDAPLTDRLLVFYRLLRPDLSGLPTVFRKGTLYVTESPLRRFTGTHYTPRFLAEQVVEGALQPLAYSPGPLQTADKQQWKLRPSSEILGLKIADIAMGSAAFLVASARYLGGRLIEAWAAKGDERAQRQVAATREVEEVIDTETDPVVIEARRLIIEHCLYGADINPMAVEMAKLSLWLVSMDPAKPFTFVDDKLAVGDSLLGITSLEQLEWMHLDPKRGRQLHEDRPWAWTKGTTDLAIEVAALRERVSRLGDSPANHARKRELLDEANTLTIRASQLADLATGAALACSARKRAAYDPNMIAADLARRATEGGRNAWGDVIDQARRWVNTDHIPGSFPRTPLHWPLAFPEVFLEKGGFDAIVGNPPFLGGQRLTGALGVAYREHLVEFIGMRARGSADLVAYFVLRAHALLNGAGQAGLLATNTLAQGDTREVGLDQLVSNGVTIRASIKSAPWPSRSAVLEYSSIWTSRANVGAGAELIADGKVVRGITPSLDPARRVSGAAHRLAENAGISFIGSYVLGMGFIIQPETAHNLIERSPRNAEVLFPYLNGEDLNSRPDCSASRWVINFHDWPEEKAKTYGECYEQVRRLVRPERLKNNRKVYRDYWWHYAEKRPAMIRAIAELDRLIIITRVSKVVMPVMVPNNQVASEATVVFAADDTAMLALLSSVPHYWWTIAWSSTLETRIRYTPSDVFETFPMPELTPEMKPLGDWLDRFRRERMLARQIGLTKMYNLVHDPRCEDPDITELREIHRQVDHAVAHAYGWDDLDLDHGFQETRQGMRYTVGPIARQELLDRLLELNHERYAVEAAAGLHKDTKKNDVGSVMRLF